MAMKKRTESLYKEWDRLEKRMHATIKGGKKPSPQSYKRRERLADAILASRRVEDKTLQKLESSLRKL